MRFSSTGESLPILRNHFTPDLMSNDPTPTTELRLRKQIAEHEAKAEALKEKLAKLLTKKSGKKGIVTGIDLLWKAAPEMARKRSSKHLCRVAWNRLPADERPQIADMVKAMEAWSKDPEWKKDGGQFVPKLDRWIKDRFWENPPEPSNPMARYQSIPKPAHQAPTPDDTVTDRNEIKRLLGMKK